MSGSEYAYHRVASRVWDDPDVADMTEDARMCWMYVLTCPERLTEGIYQLDLDAAARRLQWGRERVLEAIWQCYESTLIDYHQETSTVLILNALKYQAPANPNVAKSVLKSVRSLHWSPLVARWCEFADEHCKFLADLLDDCPELREEPRRIKEKRTRPLTVSGTVSGTVTETVSGTSISTPPPAPPPAHAPRRPSADADSGPSFDEFWTAYPRKKGKDRARKLWGRLSVGDRERALAAVAPYAATVRDIEYAKHGDTFLSQRTWEDDLSSSQPVLSAGDRALAETIARKVGQPVDVEYVEVTRGD